MRNSPRQKAFKEPPPAFLRTSSLYHLSCSSSFLHISLVFFQYTTSEFFFHFLKRLSFLPRNNGWECEVGQGQPDEAFGSHCQRQVSDLWSRMAWDRLTFQRCFLECRPVSFPSLLLFFRRGDSHALIACNTPASRKSGNRSSLPKMLVKIHLSLLPVLLLSASQRLRLPRTRMIRRRRKRRRGRQLESLLCKSHLFSLVFFLSFFFSDDDSEDSLASCLSLMATYIVSRFTAILYVELALAFTAKLRTFWTSGVILRTGLDQGFRF